MAIYVATHKKFNYKLRKCYIPIQVGTALKDDLGYLKDNGGENISEKNPNYCELTALYYIAKNRRKDKVVGLVHYRRYFFKGTHLLGFKEACDLLKKYDVILPYKLDLKESVKDQYDHYHYIGDLELCGEIIKNNTPEYYGSFKSILDTRYVVAFNMFIMSREMLEEYTDWLFLILFELENHVRIDDYDDYNKRIFGFLSERLFNVWLHCKKPKVKYLPVYNVEESFGLHVKDFVKGFVSTYLR